MIKEINGALKEISSLQERVQKLKNTANRARDSIQDDIDQSFSSFSNVLQQKIDDTDSSQNAENSTSGSPQSISKAIESASRKEGINKDLIRSVIETESGFDQKAVSEDGARGLMQLMPSTAEEIGVDPEVPEENIKGGAKYLGKMMDKYGSVKKALAAYNAGPGAVEEHNGVPPYPETQNYVKKVLSKFRQLNQSGI